MMVAARPIVAAIFEGVMRVDMFDVSKHVRVDQRFWTDRVVLL